MLTCFVRLADMSAWATADRQYPPTSETALESSFSVASVVHHDTRNGGLKCGRRHDAADIFSNTAPVLRPLLAQMVSGR
jgi:hypothetical protein